MKSHDFIQEMTLEEIDQVEGGFFWIALPMVIAAGYTIGKDRAERDNARDEQQQKT